MKKIATAIALLGLVNMAMADAPPTDPQNCGKVTVMLAASANNVQQVTFNVVQAQGGSGHWSIGPLTVDHPQDGMTVPCGSEKNTVQFSLGATPVYKPTNKAALGTPYTGTCEYRGNPVQFNGTGQSVQAVFPDDFNCHN